MRFRALKKASDHEVENWMKENVRELTQYQKSKIWEDEIVRFSPFEFYKLKKYTPSIWLRLSIVLAPFAWLVLFMGLPFNYILSGRWGYGKNIDWVVKWFDKIGL